MAPISSEGLRERRKALGLRQDQLAEIFDVHPMTVSKWERGTHAIPEMVDLALQTLERKARSGRRRKGE